MLEMQGNQPANNDSPRRSDSVQISGRIVAELVDIMSEPSDDSDDDDSYSQHDVRSDVHAARTATIQIPPRGADEAP